MKNKKRNIGIIITGLAILAVLLIGLMFWSRYKTAKDIEKEMDENHTESKHFTFIDASGKFHSTMTGRVLKNQYDVKKYKIDGNSLYDLYGKVYEADLDGKVVNDNSLPASKGMANTHMGYLDGKKITYSDDNYESEMGIDVSYHQGDIDWGQVKAAGIDFVYIRCGYRGYAAEGTLNEDPKFEEYYEGAKKNGLKVGVYFFSQAVNEKEAEEEAEYTAKLLKGKKLDLPVCFDPENAGGSDSRTYNISGKQFTLNTKAFCKKINDKGYNVMVYSNMNWEANKLDMASLEYIPVWYADYEPLPQTPYHFNIWQYSGTGTIPGISGNVDLDLRMINKSSKH